MKPPRQRKQKKKGKKDLHDDDNYCDYNLPMSKDELSFANSGMNLFAQENVQIELLKIFKKFLERSLKFLQ